MALTEIDRSLLTRCVANHPDAWRDFVDRFLGLFLHVVHHTAQSRSVPMTKDLEDDLCAEVFVRLLENDYAILRRFRGHSSLATYLTVVSRRIIVTEMARRRMAEAMGHVDGHAPPAPTAGDAQRRVENREEVEHLLGALPPRDAEILRRYHLEGQSYAEISRDMGIPENSIGPTLTRLRQMLSAKREWSHRDRAGQDGGNPAIRS